MKRVNNPILLTTAFVGLVFTAMPLTVAAAAVAPAAEAAKSAKGKKLQAPQMGMLNGLLVGLPLAAVQMSMTHREAVKIINALPTIEENKEQIAKHIKNMLAPVKDSLSLIKQHVNMILPLVTESLGKDRVNASVLVKAFHANTTVDEYFAQHVVTKQTLHALADEVKTFFGDIQASLSPEALAAYKAEIAKIKANAERNRVGN